MTEIVNQEGYSFGIISDESLRNRYFEEGGIEVPVCEENFIRKKWDFTNQRWIESATSDYIAELNRLKVPHELSRMKFIIQVFLATGIKYEDIVLFIQGLPVEALDDASKYIVLTKLRGCTHFERYSADLLSIAQMMNINEEQLDEIFINGNNIQ